MDSQLDKDKADIIELLGSLSPSRAEPLIGSMATGKVYHAFGLKYGAAGLREAILAGSRSQVDEALKTCDRYFATMREHRRFQCPACGNQVAHIPTRVYQIMAIGTDSAVLWRDVGEAEWEAASAEHRRMLVTPSEGTD